MVCLAFFRVRALIPRPCRATVSSWTMRAPRGGLWALALAWFPGFAEESLCAGEGCCQERMTDRLAPVSGPPLGRGPLQWYPRAWSSTPGVNSAGAAGLCTRNMCKRFRQNLPGCSSLACLCSRPAAVPEGFLLPTSLSALDVIHPGNFCQSQGRKIVSPCFNLHLSDN